MKHLLISLGLYFILLVNPTMMPRSAAQNDKDHRTASKKESRIEHNQTGKTIELEKLLDQLSHSDIVFLGEQHNNDSGHEFQLNVIKGLFEKGHSIAISTEQFERDVQGALDDYLSGRLDEDAFLKSSRPWKNYRQHYRPIVEFAKQNKIPVIAANIPRRIASEIATGKKTSAPEDQAFFPRHTTAPKNAYWQKFKATMEGHVGADGDSKIENFYASQCLKDDAMAEAITDFIAANGHKPIIVVHLCGHFHSDYGLGSVSRVMQRRPLTRFSVVTMESVESESGKKKSMSNFSARAHFTFWSVKNAETKK